MSHLYSGALTIVLSSGRAHSGSEKGTNVVSLVRVVRVCKIILLLDFYKVKVAVSGEGHAIGQYILDIAMRMRLPTPKLCPASFN